MDAVGVGARVGLLLRREDLALPDGVHGGVPVLAPLRHGGDVHEGDGHPRRRRPGDVGRHLEHVPVRPQPYRPTPVHQRHRLLRAPDAVRVSPHLRAVFQTQKSPSQIPSELQNQLIIVLELDTTLLQWSTLALADSQMSRSRNPTTLIRFHLHVK